MIVLKTDINDHYTVKFSINVGGKPAIEQYRRQRDFRKFSDQEFFDHAKYVNCRARPTEQILCPHKAAEFLENKIELRVDQFAPFKSQK